MHRPGHLRANPSCSRLVQSSDYTGRNASEDGIGLHVAGDDGPGRHHGVVADGDARRIVALAPT